MGRCEGRGNRSMRSGRSSRAGSVRSIGSGISQDGLSIEEVMRVKRLVNVMNREKRKNNIIIRGVRLLKEREGGKRECAEWARSLLKEKVGVEGEVISCRMSGTVLIVKLGSEDYKKEVMRNKYKLRGETIFIEIDLSWEERKMQEKINNW